MYLVICKPNVLLAYEIVSNCLLPGTYLGEAVEFGVYTAAAGSIRDLLHTKCMCTTLPGMIHFSLNFFACVPVQQKILRRCLHYLWLIFPSYTTIAIIIITIWTNFALLCLSLLTHTGKWSTLVRRLHSCGTSYAVSKRSHHVTCHLWKHGGEERMFLPDLQEQIRLAHLSVVRSSVGYYLSQVMLPSCVSAAVGVRVATPAGGASTEHWA